MTGPCIGASFQSVFFANWMMRTTELRELPSLWGIIHNSPKDFSNGFLGGSISPNHAYFHTSWGFASTCSTGIQRVRIIQNHPSTSPCTNQLRPRKKKKTSFDEKLPSLTFQKKNGSHEAGQSTVFFQKNLRWIDLPTGPRFWSSFGRLGGLEREKQAGEIW